MDTTTLAAIAIVGTLIYLVGVILGKVDKSIEETQEERMARLFEGMKARRVAMERAHVVVPARRRGDFTRV
jgi:hypothetical protein